MNINEGQLGRVTHNNQAGPYGSYYAPAVKQPVEQITPLLKQRMEELGMVLPPFAAIGDRVFVWPIKEKDKSAATVSVDKVGSIYMPTATKNKHMGQVGIVMKMGARAHEELYSHGIEPGHLVLFALFSPRIREYPSPLGLHEMVLMRSGDIIGSAELQDLYDQGNVWLTRDPATGRVELNDRDRIDPVQADDQ